MKNSEILRCIIFLVLSSVLIIGCKSNKSKTVVVETTDVATIALPKPSLTPTIKPIGTITLTSSLMPSATPTPPPTATPTPPPTAPPTWVFNNAGKVVAPILLYHHIEENGGNRYYVSPEEFHAQMIALREWGYTTIPISLLVDALVNGAELPARPVVISFDDGDISVYENAYPIMQDVDFTGVFYIVSNRLESQGFVNVNQLKEMIVAGWEVGSHSQSHIDLPTNHDVVHAQIRQSKLDLEYALGTEIATFAYPFGTIDDYIVGKVQDYGYEAAVGLGKSWTNKLGNLYYLERIEVYGNYTLDDIAARLPWVAEDEE